VTAAEPVLTTELPEFDTVLVGDVWRTRDEARAAARYLRDQGFSATVETSGPPRRREYRVFVPHATTPRLVPTFTRATGWMITSRIGSRYKQEVWFSTAGRLRRLAQNAPACFARRDLWAACRIL
jgi:hypothetical protein